MFDPNAYFKSLAEKHVDIQHTDEKPGFFREFSSAKILFDNSDFLSKMRYSGRVVLVSQFNGDGSFFGPHSDSTFRDHSGAIYVLVKLIDRNIEEAKTLADNVMQDIVLKLKDDSDIGNISPENNIKTQNIAVHALGSIADHYYGVTAFISFSHPVCEQSNPAKWI